MLFLAPAMAWRDEAGQRQTAGTDRRRPKTLIDEVSVSEHQKANGNEQQEAGSREHKANRWS